MKNPFLIFILFCLNFSFAQISNKLEFTPLIVIGKIADKTKINQLKKGSDLKENSFFITNWTDKTNTLQKVLVYKKDKTYIVFKIPNEDETFNSFELSDNKNFITYTTDYKFGGRDHFEAKSHFQIIDLQNLTFLSINNLLQTEDWEEEKPVVVSKCECEIILKMNILSVKMKTSKNLGYKTYFDENCISGGKYKIENKSLIKITKL